MTMKQTKKQLIDTNKNITLALDANRREVTRLSEMLGTTRQMLDSTQHDLAVTRVTIRKLSKENHCYESLLKMLNSELLTARIEIQSQRYTEPEQQVKTMIAATKPAKP